MAPRLLSAPLFVTDEQGIVASRNEVGMEQVPRLQAMDGPDVVEGLRDTVKKIAGTVRDFPDTRTVTGISGDRRPCLSRRHHGHLGNINSRPAL